MSTSSYLLIVQSHNSFQAWHGSIIWQCHFVISCPCTLTFWVRIAFNSCVSTAACLLLLLVLFLGIFLGFWRFWALILKVSLLTTVPALTSRFFGTTFATLPFWRARIYCHGLILWVIIPGFSPITAWALHLLAAKFFTNKWDEDIRIKGLCWGVHLCCCELGWCKVGKWYGEWGQDGRTVICYNFKQLTDKCLYLCLVLGRLSIVYSHLLGSRFNLNSSRVPLGSGIV